MDTEKAREILEQQRSELKQRLERIRADISAGRSRDLEDQAQERENDQVLEGLATEAVDELEDIQRALHRLDDDTYGQCEKCGEPIAEARLEANPAAEYCIDCAR